MNHEPVGAQQSQIGRDAITGGEQNEVPRHQVLAGHRYAFPVAHNAGLLWPRNGFLKRPGLVTVRIGPAIDSTDREPEAINRLAETWIEAQQRELCPSS